jgi:hypothetical protein
VEVVGIIGVEADAVGTELSMIAVEVSGVVQVEADPLRDETEIHIKGTVTVMCLKDVVGAGRTCAVDVPQLALYLQTRAAPPAHGRQAIRVTVTGETA